MLKIANLVGVIVLYAAFPAWTQIHDPVQPSGITLEERKPADSSKKVACECCRQCTAAKKPVDPEEPGPPATGGCGDCCERCGRVDQPLKEKIPPEIIEKKLPPILKD